MEQATGVVVLDDDPTGTQCSRDVSVLLEWGTSAIADELLRSGVVFLQTNSRALSQQAAVQVACDVHGAIGQLEQTIGGRPDILMRGDSTLRGHTFAESDVFMDHDSVLLYVPAFPDAGRITVDGQHQVALADGTFVPAHTTEFARDPIFGYTTSLVTDLVRQQSGRPAVGLDARALRQSAGSALSDLLITAPPGAVIVPDAATNGDLDLIAESRRLAITGGRSVVLRGAAPIVARCADRLSVGTLPLPAHRSTSVLVVCGSHTDGARHQLKTLADSFGVAVHVVDADEAILDPQRAAKQVNSAVSNDLTANGLAIVASPRDRRADHNTLVHGEAVMSALTAVVATVRDQVDGVVVKGGITSAEVAKSGLGARSAYVLGQVQVGVSVWQVPVDGNTIPYVIVPGNLGSDRTVADCVDWLRS